MIAKYQVNIILIFVILLVLPLVFTIIGLNIFPNEERFMLHMDERISFDNIKKIYESSDLYSLLKNIFFIGDHRYGSLFYSFYAFFSLPSYLLFGDPGLIFSNRVVGFFLWVLSAITLAQFFFKSHFKKFFLIIVLVLTPFANYFFFMPKPEPLQLATIVLGILCYISKKNYKLGFLFFGVALGLKISILPFVASIYILSILTRKISVNDTLCIKFIILGLCIGEPMLMPQIALIYPFYYLLKTFSTKITFRFKNHAVIIISLIFGIVLSYFSFAIWGVKTPFAIYAASTLFNTGHGYDISYINLFDWVEFIKLSFFSFEITFYVLVILIACIFFWIIKSLNYMTDSMIIFTAAFCNLLIIILFTQRLWGFYLPVMLSLIIISIFKIIDDMKKDKSFLLAPLLIIFLSDWGFALYSSIKSFDLNSHIKNTDIKKAAYEQLNNIISGSLEEKQDLVISIDAWSIPLHPNTKLKVYENFGHLWNFQTDIIVISDKTINWNNYYHPDSKIYKNILNSSLNLFILDSNSFGFELHEVLADKSRVYIRK